MEFIDLKAQQARIRARIDARIRAVLDHGQYILGPEIGELEAQLAGHVGVRHAIAVADGTTALLIALMALDIRAGDEVVTTPFTFFATAEMIALLGAVPVFVDIEPDTWNIDARRIEAAITPRTRAIMPVSLYGQCADLAAINAIAAQHGLPVIEDGAQSFGARHRGRPSCGLSTIGCTSFFPSKPLGCYGDGGACFTDDDALAKRMRALRVHGQDRRYHHPLLGLNGRLDTLQAAVLLEKFTIFPAEVEARAAIGRRYTEALSASPHLRVPVLRAENSSVYAQYTVEVEAREHVADALRAQGIPTAVHYPLPLHLQPVFAGRGQGVGSFPVAERAAERVLSLPMHPYLSPADQDRVVRALLSAVAARS